MRIHYGRAKGATALVMNRPDVRGIKSYSCEKCGANPSMRCRKWKEADGIRFVAGYKTGYCKGRGRAVQP